MADFCFQCGVDLFLDPRPDLDNMCSPGAFAAVICEGCGPTLVDHRGWCVDEGCIEGHGDYEHIPPDRSEVYERAWRWVERRSGPLGPFLRLRDRILGSSWEPGYVHFPGHPWWYVRELFSAVYEGRPVEWGFLDAADFLDLEAP